MSFSCSIRAAEGIFLLVVMLMLTAGIGAIVGFHASEYIFQSNPLARVLGFIIGASIGFMLPLILMHILGGREEV